MIGRECLDVVHEIRRFKDPLMREHPHARGIIKCNRARQLMIAANDDVTRARRLSISDSCLLHFRSSARHEEIRRGTSNFPLHGNIPRLGSPRYHYHSNSIIARYYRPVFHYSREFAQKAIRHCGDFSRHDGNSILGLSRSGGGGRGEGEGADLKPPYRAIFLRRYSSRKGA